MAAIAAGGMKRQSQPTHDAIVAPPPTHRRQRRERKRSASAALGVLAAGRECQGGHLFTAHHGPALPPGDFFP